MTMIAQLILEGRSNNQYVLLIRRNENEITYQTGNSALSNHFDMTKLKSIYNGQSNADIVADTVKALKYDIVVEAEIADKTIWTIKDGSLE